MRFRTLGGSHAGVSKRPSLSRASSHLHNSGDGGQQHTVTHVRAMAPQEPGLGIDGLRTLSTQSEAFLDATQVSARGQSPSAAAEAGPVDRGYGTAPQTEVVLPCITLTCPGVTSSMLEDIFIFQEVHKFPQAHLFVPNLSQVAGLGPRRQK